MTSNTSNNTSIHINCSYCGKFIKHRDLQEGRATYEFTPDSAYSGESMVIICPACVAENKEHVNDLLYN